jgi:hypothetical protein
MAVHVHLHAQERMEERGATTEKVRATVEHGESFLVKFGRTGFRRNFRFDQHRHGRYYHTKQLEAYAVQEGTDWLVIPVFIRSL